MDKRTTADGIYTAYLTGLAGNTFAMFVFKDGVIAGGDASGGIYDGYYSLDEDGKTWSGAVSFLLHPGTATITGQIATDEQIRLEVPIRLPLNFTIDQFVRMETPAGPLNARFVLVRKL